MLFNLIKVNILIIIVSQNYTKEIDMNKNIIYLLFLTNINHHSTNIGYTQMKPEYFMKN